MEKSGYRKILSITMILGVMLGVFILQGAVMFIVMAVMKVDYKNIAGDSMFNTVFYAVYPVATLVLLLLARCLIMEYSPIEPFEDNKKLRDRKVSAPWLILLGISLQSLFFGMLNIINMFAAETRVFKNYDKIMDSIAGNNIIVMLVYTAFMGPILEEVIFRGIIIDFARYGFSKKASIIISAVSFGIFHGNIIQCCYAIPLGCILGYVKMRRGRLSDSIILHMAVNISGILIFPVICYILALFVGEMTSYVILMLLGIPFTVLWYRNGKITNSDSESSSGLI